MPYEESVCNVRGQGDAATYEFTWRYENGDCTCGSRDDCDCESDGSIVRVFSENFHVTLVGKGLSLEFRNMDEAAEFVADYCEHFMDYEGTASDIQHDLWMTLDPKNKSVRGFRISQDDAEHCGEAAREGLSKYYFDTPADFKRALQSDFDMDEESEMSD